MIVDYLCRSGEPPVFFEMQNPVNPNANRRRAGYIAAMEALGHKPEIVRVDGQGWSFEQIGFTGGGSLIESGAFATNTVLCSNDRLAIGLIAAAYSKGVRVGRGPDCALRVAGMDDHPFAQFTCPPMTTIAQDYAAIADHSVETLFNVIDNGPPTDARPETLFEGRLVMRDSA